MRDLASVMWKEFAEMVGGQRSLRVFGIAVILMGIAPSLLARHSVLNAVLFILLRIFYVLLATVIVVANTAPDLVLHEKVGRTFDYLLATRLPDWAIYGGKVVVAAAVGYIAALVAIVLQLAFAALFSGQGWNWLFLGDSAGRILALGMTADLSLYVAVVGTFVALRVGEQRSAYLVTVLSIGIWIIPFLLGWWKIGTTTAWFAHATELFAVVAIVLGVLGTRLFRREMLVLYLQE
jgi:hypothetical protein